MRLVLMGTGPFAVPAFDRIVREGHDIVRVVARPAVIAAGKAPPESPVAVWAGEAGLRLETPDSMNTAESILALQSDSPDVLVVCDYGQILSREALSAARWGGINLHGSLLPRHRGAAPVQWSILSGDARAGVSVIHMTPHLDAGPILATAQTLIELHEDAGELERRLSQLGVEPTLEALSMLQQNATPTGIAGDFAPQDSGLATRAPRLKKLDGLLHLGYPVEWIDRQLRGLQPWPGVYTQLITPDGKRLRILLHRARPMAIDASALVGHGVGDVVHGAALEPMLGHPPGASKGAMAAVAGNGLLWIESLQPAGKKIMLADEFLRGYARHAWLKLEVPEGPQPLLEKMIAMGSQGVATG